jgi:hypothetical protein
VPRLPMALVATALGRGADEARAQIAAGHIVAAVLSLQGRWSVVGDVAAKLPARPSPPRSVHLEPVERRAAAIC